MKHHTVIAAFLVVGLIFVALSWQTGHASLRLVFGFPFVYAFAGYPLSLLVLKKTNNFLERLIMSSGLSLLLTYPAGFLNVLKEGQTGQAIFGYHLFGDSLALFLIFCFSTGLVVFKNLHKNRLEPIKNKRLGFVILTIFLFSLVLNLYRSGVPDQNGDEYDLGYQAYNLVDGIQAGRQAYVLSFSAHPPLVMYIQHYTLQILQPQSLDLLTDQMYRVAPAILGALTVVVSTLIAFELTGSTVAGLSSGLLLCVSTYQLFLSRIFHREMILTFFIALSILSLIRFLKTKSSHYFLLMIIFSGAAMLSKATAVILVAFIALVLILRYRKLSIKPIIIYGLGVLIIWLPVILYNLGAYLKTGYTDIFFSRLFHTKVTPGATAPSPNLLANLIDILQYLIDIYGPAVILLYSIFCLISVRFLKRNQNYLNLSFLFISLVFFTFSGVRNYYLAFLGLPLTLMAGIQIYYLSKTNKVIAGLLFGVTFSLSSYYSALNLFILSPNSSSGIHEMLSDRHWKSLSLALLSLNVSGKCLDIDPKIPDLLTRRYLGVNDKIKEYYLGPNFPRRYKLCSEIDNSQEKIIITTDALTGVVKWKII